MSFGAGSSRTMRPICVRRLGVETEHDAWLKTDPQDPKSIWWYSDIRSVGFRVVCEPPEGTVR